MIKAAFFDYGGVLSPGGSKDSAHQIMTDFYGTVLPWAILASLHAGLRRGEISSDAFFQGIRDAYRQAGGPDQVMTETEWLSANTALLARNEQVYQFAARLRDAGIITGILSNVYEFEAGAARRAGNYDEFDPVVLSCDQQVRSQKPEHIIFLRALERLGVHGPEVLCLDDQEKNRGPAQHLGMQAIIDADHDLLIDRAAALLRAENGITL